MIIAYWIVFGILMIIGIAVTLTFFSEVEDGTGKEIIRYFSIATFASWGVALTWPVLLCSIIPVMFIYGAWSAIRALKNKGIDY